MLVWVFSIFCCEKIVDLVVTVFVLNFHQSVMIAGKIRFSFFTFLAFFHSKTVSCSVFRDLIPAP